MSTIIKSLSLISIICTLLQSSCVYAVNEPSVSFNPQLVIKTNDYWNNSGSTDRNIGKGSASVFAVDNYGCLTNQSIPCYEFDVKFNLRYQQVKDNTGAVTSTGRVFVLANPGLALLFRGDIPTYDPDGSYGSKLMFNNTFRLDLFGDYYNLWGQTHGGFSFGNLQKPNCNDLTNPNCFEEQGGWIAGDCIEYPYRSVKSFSLPKVVKNWVDHNNDFKNGMVLAELNIKCMKRHNSGIELALHILDMKFGRTVKLMKNNNSPTSRADWYLPKMSTAVVMAYTNYENGSSDADAVKYSFIRDLNPVSKHIKFNSRSCEHSISWDNGSNRLTLNNIPSRTPKTYLGGKQLNFDINCMTDRSLYYRGQYDFNTGKDYDYDWIASRNDADAYLNMFGSGGNSQIAQQNLVGLRRTAGTGLQISDFRVSSLNSNLIDSGTKADLGSGLYLEWDNNSQYALKQCNAGQGFKFNEDQSGRFTNYVRGSRSPNLLDSGVEGKPESFNGRLVPVKQYDTVRKLNEKFYFRVCKPVGKNLFPTDSTQTRNFNISYTIR